jgi:TetR/AcrR family transcriptional regulator, regulator of cefoperazone and chloramphenicol sensitivity
MRSKGTPMTKAAQEGAGSNGKHRLIQVAMQMFADKGFDGITVRDIASAANVSVGLINHHFGSKEGLREAVDHYFLSQFEEILQDEYRVTENQDDRGLDIVVERTEDWINRHIDDWDLSKSYMRRALLEGSDWGANIFDRFYQVQRSAVDRMDVEGQLRADVDRLWLPLLIIYMELGTLLLEPYVEKMLGRSGFDRTLWRRRHRAYSDLIIRGVSPLKN